MSSSILSVGQSALAAAQAGLATTGHNIANANTPGYSRQIVLQASAGSQNAGFGYVGKGAAVADVRRVFNDLLATQVRSAQSTQNQVQAYYDQIKQIDNQLADTTSGLSPVLQDFFKGIQDLAANPNAAASRQAALSSAQALAARFQSLDGQLKEVEQSVNSQITSAVTAINTHAAQIAKLNDAIEKAAGNGDGHVSNDLLDQRDYAITQLSKEIKTTVVKQGNSFNILIGSGQPLVVGAKTQDLTVVASDTNRNRMQIAYHSNGKLVPLSESSLSGGRLGGLLEFRSKSMEPAQNALGRVAIGLAITFNAQHNLGQDQTGQLGGNFFAVAVPRVEASRNNLNSPPTPVADIKADITDPSKLTTSDYRISYVSGPPSPEYVVTRLPENSKSTFTSFPGGDGQAIPGVKLTEPAGTPMQVNDEFLIRPTADGAAKFAVEINDVSKIAAGAPISATAPLTNVGTGKISAGVVSSTLLMRPGATSGLSLAYAPGSPGTVSISSPVAKPITVISPPVAPSTEETATVYPAGTPVPYTVGQTIMYDGIRFSNIPGASTNTAGTLNVDKILPMEIGFANGGLSGFPAQLDVSVKGADGKTVNYAAGTTPIPFKDGDTISTGGITFTVTGSPKDGDKFSIKSNPNGVGDSRNAVLLGSLQGANTLADGTTTYQGAYAHLVSFIGNKTHELEVTYKAESAYLEQAETAMEAESGVNLDEEATNLLRYQQAYQAAAKVMQTANTLFDTLLTLGT